MTSSGNRTGIFGGAFDPVHLGHLKIAGSFLSSNVIDSLLVLPTPNSPHKETDDQTDFSHRYEMLKLAFQDHRDVIVSNLETELPSPSYTLRTIEYLQRTNPEETYFLCIGEDSLSSFHTWWKYDEILRRVPLVVASRPGVDSSDISRNILERALFVDHEDIDISSTQIRKKARERDNRLNTLVPENVAQYIFRHHLYSD